jgi:hypothetical protein
VTPARLQRFRPLPGGGFVYRVTRIVDGAVVQEGKVTADAAGTVTVPGVNVARDGVRLQILDATLVGVIDPPRSPRLALSIPGCPARGRIVLDVTWPTAGEASLELFDLTGRRVRTVYCGAATASPPRFVLDAAELPPGLYFARARASGEQSVKRLEVLR